METVSNLDPVLSRALSIDGQVDYEELTRLLRELRRATATGDELLRCFALVHVSLVKNLVAFADKIVTTTPSDPQSIVAFQIAVQCMVNLMSNSKTGKEMFANEYAATITRWLRSVDDDKSINYVSAALLNIDHVHGLDDVLTIPEFACSLVEAGIRGAEFAILLLQNILETKRFLQLYTIVKEEKKPFLLQLLADSIGRLPIVFLEEIHIIANEFKKICDNMMSSIPSVSPLVASQLALFLEILGSASCKNGYSECLQEDAALVVSSSFLLRGIHECIAQKSDRESQKEAFESVKGDNKEIKSRPFYGVKGDLIRLLGNLAFAHKPNQDRIRESGVIPIILDSCKLDGENPFIKEWSILAIRNLCEKNSENQNVIRLMDLKGMDPTVLHEFGFTMTEENGSQIGIAPIQKLSK